MPALCSDDAFSATDAFLCSLYGDQVFEKWVELKQEMNFFHERDFVSWLLEVADSYRHMQEQGEPETATEEEAEAGYTLPTCHSEASEYRVETGLINPVPVNTKTEALSDAISSDVWTNSYSYSSTSDAPVSANNQIELQTKIDPDLLDSPADEAFTGGSHLQPYSNLSSIRQRFLLAPDPLCERDGPGGNYSCSHCSYTCTFKCNLKSHLIYKHNYPSDHRCSHCNKGFHSRNIFESRGTPSRKQYSCDHCQYVSSNKNGLRDHIIAIHQKLKPVACPHCSYSCAKKSNLKSHLMYKHNYKGNHLCDHCGKAFQRSKLEMHMKKCRTAS